MRMLCCRLGAFFSPLIPAICVFKFFILFYVKKVSFSNIFWMLEESMSSGDGMISNRRLKLIWQSSGLSSACFDFWVADISQLSS